MSFNRNDQMQQMKQVMAHIATTNSIGKSIDLTEDWTGEVRYSKFVKKYNVSEIPEDLLVLSTTWYRLRNGKGVSDIPHISSLLDDSLFKLITKADRESAETIRDYYSKKLMMLTLKEHHLTKFREDLGRFIQSDGRVFTDDIPPMVFRLPEFYEYDLERDKIRLETAQPKEKSKMATARGVTQTLTPIKHLKRKLKRGVQEEYWFKDKDNFPYVVNIEPNNSCLSLWQREFAKEKLLMSFNRLYSEQDNWVYFRVKHWEIE